MAQLAFSDESYFSRSWKMLRRDKGWYKPILLLALASLVPIVGPLGVLGYALEWARLTAWGVESAPKQRDVKIGACIKTGFRGAVVALCYSLAAAVLFGVLRAIFGATFLSAIVEIVIWVATLFLATLGYVAALHATIYEKFGAGFKVKRIYTMVKTAFSGFAKVTGINFLMGLAVGCISVLVWLILAIPTLGSMAYQLSYLASYADMGLGGSDQVMSVTATLLSSLIPAIIVGILVGLVLNAAVLLVTVNMVGLWMLQFDVPAWGDPDSQLPDRLLALPAACTDVPVDPTAPVTTPVSPVAPASVSPAPVSIPSPTQPACEGASVEPAADSEHVDRDGPASQGDAPEADEAPVEEEQVTTLIPAPEEEGPEDVTSADEAEDVDVAEGEVGAEGDSVPMKCPSCGSLVVEGQNFCPSCGARVKE